MEIRYDGEWGTICDTGWGIRDAEVACRQLGYSHATDALHNAHFGEGHGPVHIALVRCRGNESELAFCPKLPLSRFLYCNHGDDASVRCSGEYISTSPYSCVQAFSSHDLPLDSTCN